MRSGNVVGAFCYKWARSVISIYPIRLKDVCLLTQGQALGKQAEDTHPPPWGTRVGMAAPGFLALWPPTVWVQKAALVFEHIDIVGFQPDFWFCFGGLSIFRPVCREKTIMKNGKQAPHFPWSFLWSGLEVSRVTRWQDPASSPLSDFSSSVSWAMRLKDSHFIYLAMPFPGMSLRK